MWYLWRIAQTLEIIWSCVQVGEMNAVQWLLWTDFLNHLHVMTVRNTGSK